MIIRRTSARLLKTRFSLVSLVFVFAAATGFPAFSQNIAPRGITIPKQLESVVTEIEARTGKTIYTDLEPQPQYQLGASFIDEDGRAVVLIDPALDADAKKLEAVLAHELLHLRLTVNNYPSYLFSPTIRTAKGLAIDVEQSNMNDLRSLIEHKIFKPDMVGFGLDQLIDLAGDTAAIAKKRKGQADGQNDVINYVRALLEYHDAKNVEAVRQAYVANGWTRSVKTGTTIAAIIKAAVIRTPKDAESVFLRCLLQLYPPPGRAYSFMLSPDPENKYFRRLIVNVNQMRKR